MKDAILKKWISTGLTLKGWSKKLTDDEAGATAIEYGLFAALIAVVIIAAVGAIGNELNNVFNLVANKLKGVTTT